MACCYGVAAGALNLALVSYAGALAVLALLMIPLGLPLSSWLGSLNASVQRAVPSTLTTEAFSWTFAVITVGIAAGNALGGLVVRAGGPQVAFLAAGSVSLAAAVLGALSWKRRPVLQS